MQNAMLEFSFSLRKCATQIGKGAALIRIFTH